MSIIIEAGQALPDDINVIIEISANSQPVKYEIDKKSGRLVVDRFVMTNLSNPCNYGFIPSTLSEDGDPLDVLVVTRFPLLPGVMIRCRPIGLLRMTDESGPDAKILAVPLNKIDPTYANIQSPKDLGETLLNTIAHYFEHYKDLEPGKWTKIKGWEDAEAAKKEIKESVKRYQSGN